MTSVSITTPFLHFPNGKVLVSQSSESYPFEAASWISDRRRALAKHGQIPVTGLSGGSTPRPIYKTLAAMSANDPELLSGNWIQIDERDVSSDHPDSNQRMIRETLLAKTPFGANFVAFPEKGGTPERSAQRYEADLRRLRPGLKSPADLALLGIGVDGHTASLFPGTEWMGEKDSTAWVTWFKVGNPGELRLSLTFVALIAIPDLVFLVSGAGKAEIAARLLMGQANHLPAGALSAVRGATWLLDPPAAVILPIPG